MKVPTIKQVSLSDIVPYWRNPRNNTETIAHVKKSIEDFGYQVPIVVDANNVILAGHTRYKALLSLGWTEVDVAVVDWLSETQARQYRIADNKASEFSNWDIDALKRELDGLEDAASIFTVFQQGDWRNVLELDEQMAAWEEQLAAEEVSAELPDNDVGEVPVYTPAPPAFVPVVTPQDGAHMGLDVEDSEEEEDSTPQATAEAPQAPVTAPAATGGSTAAPTTEDDSYEEEDEEDEAEQPVHLTNINLVCPHCAESISETRETILQWIEDYAQS